MNNPIQRMSATAVLAALISACGTSEQVLDITYFQGLGVAKTSDYLKACVAEKKPLLERHDAAGLDRFAKSARAANCLTAFKFAVDEEDKTLGTQRKAFETATSQEALKTARDTIHQDFESRWNEIITTFPEWKNFTNPLASAIRGVDIAYSNASSKLAIKGMINYRR